MSKRIEYGRNSFFRRIILTVMAGIILIGVVVSVVVLVMSKDVFTETYGNSQEKVFDRIEKELNDFHVSLQEIINAIDSSWAFRLYFNGEEKLDNVQNFQNIYQMEKDLEKEKTADMERLNILVVGMNGRHYLARTETISISDEEILASEAVQIALTSPEKIHYTYSHGAYTATTQNSDVIIVSKALYLQESQEVYAVVLVTLTMEDMKTYYDYFITENSDFYLVGKDDIVMCSNEDSMIGKCVTDVWYDMAKNSDESRIVINSHENDTIMKRELPYLGCSMYGFIDNNMALERLYNMPVLILVCSVIGFVVLVMCLAITRNTMRPLSQLVKKMSTLREGNFTQYMRVEGTREVRELAITYNYMLNDIQKYIDKLIEAQKEQRKSEIKSLQMQINPHYIYNTLASIKWLVYQNDSKKTIQTIDAFISLLRNTISNMDEFITIEQEMENLRNYILINHTRYGEAVKVEYYVSYSCYECVLPKMILQPFIENVFFHAFPSGRSGTIQIFVKRKEQNLEIRIVDDGIGMNQSKVEQVLKEKNSKEHFSGIGIHNVQERLKLLYGEAYGIQIDSEEEKGTVVTVTLPVVIKEKEETQEEPLEEGEVDHEIHK